MSKKMPWEPGKSSTSPRRARHHPASKVGHLSKARIQLKVNDQVHQDDDISAMIYDVPSIIAFLSKSVALAAGDIIYTGTPAAPARGLRRSHGRDDRAAGRPDHYSRLGRFGCAAH